jgi:hypothetical protein
MTSKAFGLAQLGNAYSDGALSNRNLIINGAMQVWQRGTSFTVGGSDTYTTDRWTAREGVVSRSTDVPTNEGFKYSLFYDNDGTRAGINFRQKIEDGKTLLVNRPVILSFWLKSSVNTTITVDWSDTNTTMVAVTTEWHRYEVAFPATNINPSNIFSGSAWVDFNFGGDYPDIYITGVQLEVGNTVTPFEHRSYGQELFLCQRYYETNYQAGLAPGSGTSQNMVLAVVPGNINRAFGHLQFQVKKRASATVTFYSTSGESGVFRNASQGTNITMSPAASSGDSGMPYEASSDIIAVTDRIQGLYTAEAEL